MEANGETANVQDLRLPPFSLLLSVDCSQLSSGLEHDTASRSSCLWSNQSRGIFRRTL